MPDYFDRYENFRLQRTDSGVLTVRMHTDDGPITFTGTTHREFPRLLADIGEDRDNRVVVLTGSGDAFMDDIDGASLGEIFKPPSGTRPTGRAGASCSACSSWRPR
jgi:enoyl-CoA hydratase/carnithine racemase